MGGPVIPSEDSIITGHVVTEQTLYPILNITISRAYTECFLWTGPILEDMVMNKPPKPNSSPDLKSSQYAAQGRCMNQTYTPAGAPQRCMSIVQGGADKKFTSWTALSSFQ